MSPWQIEFPVKLRVSIYRHFPPTHSWHNHLCANILIINGSSISLGISTGNGWFDDLVGCKWFLYIYITSHLIIWTAVQPSADLVRSVATQRRKGESLGGASWTAAPWVRPQSLLLLSCTTPLEWVLSRSQLSARSSCLRRREGNREVLKYSYYEEAENIVKITCKWLSDHLNSTVTNCSHPPLFPYILPFFLPGI